ncbi:hypothetical protein FGA82_11170 [Pseudomonas fluorescens]|nr:hypothetical protein FGA82_11170 [Pseudomonas fluorescens]
MWERACSRKGRHIQDQNWLTQHFREQARSHRFRSDLAFSTRSRTLLAPTGFAVDLHSTDTHPAVS